MKKIILGIILSIFTIISFAQQQTDTIYIKDTITIKDTIIKHDTNIVQIFDTITINKDSITLKILEKLKFIGGEINGADCIKLYPTKNMYNFLKLNTATGQIEQVQWTVDGDDEFICTLNSEDLSFGTGCGTFELYPTTNMYQFLLLDQVTDRVWHVQWGMSSNKRWIRRIY